MTTWWEGLTPLNQTLYGIAVLVSVPFAWQLIAALIGLSSGESDFGGVEAPDVDVDVDVDLDVDVDVDGAAEAIDVAHGAAGGAVHGSGDAVATVFAFKLLSVRAILTFLTLFAWGCALYLEQAGGKFEPRILGIASLWGLAGMAVVAIVMSLMTRLSYSGTRDLDAALGSEATVYIDIPADGTGEVRAMVGGHVNYVKARTKGGEALKAGTPVVIRERVGQTLLIVEPK